LRRNEEENREMCNEILLAALASFALLIFTAPGDSSSWWCKGWMMGWKGWGVQRVDHMNLGFGEQFGRGLGLLSWR